MQKLRRRAPPTCARLAKKPLRYNEYNLQVEIIDEFHRCLAPEVVFFSVPNERNTSKIAGHRLKRAGRLAGVSDLLVTWPGPDGFPRGAVLEVKAPRGSVTKAQRLFLGRARAAGWVAAVVRSVDSAMETLEAAGCPMRLLRRSSGRRYLTPTVKEAA